ncbi:collagen, middle region [Amycolatopsis rubida]|uniref:Collagen, middle region n=1 Tax=Amycolatopsis rubida TaxID=112413 RepID=A0A1I5IB43_9PSEU|nr:collagen, middle region [Amycolatopsis rubida]
MARVSWFGSAQGGTGLAWVRAGLARFGARLTRLGAGLARLGAGLARFGAALARFGTALARLGTGLARFGAALARLGTALARFGTALARLGTALAQLGTALARFGTALAQLGTGLARFGAALAQLGAGLAQLGATLPPARRSTGAARRSTRQPAAGSAAGGRHRGAGHGSPNRRARGAASRPLSSRGQTGSDRCDEPGWHGSSRTRLTLAGRSEDGWDWTEPSPDFVPPARFASLSSPEGRARLGYGPVSGCLGRLPSPLMRCGSGSSSTMGFGRFAPAVTEAQLNQPFTVPKSRAPVTSP